MPTIYNCKRNDPRAIRATPTKRKIEYDKEFNSPPVDGRTKACREMNTVQPRFFGPRSSYRSAVLNSFSTKRSILIGAGLGGKRDCLFRASKQISSISPRSSKYNWKGNGPEGVGTLRTLPFFRRFAQFSNDVFGSQFAALYLFHGRSERKAQLRV